MQSDDHLIANFAGGKKTIAFHFHIRCTVGKLAWFCYAPIALFYGFSQPYIVRDSPHHPLESERFDGWWCFLLVKGTPIVGAAYKHVSMRANTRWRNHAAINSRWTMKRQSPSKQSIAILRRIMHGVENCCEMIDWLVCLFVRSAESSPRSESASSACSCCVPHQSGRNSINSW